MVFGELVDTVPIFGSQRKAYVLHRRAVDGRGPGHPRRRRRPLAHLRPRRPSLHPRRHADGDRHRRAGRGGGRDVHRGGAAHRRRRATSGPDNDVRVELGMVQVLGRLAVSAGVLAVAGLSGWLANFMPRQDVFLIGLIIPAISVAGVFLRGTETMERRPIDWRILGGGIVFGVVVVVLGVGGMPFGQEIIFVISMAVVCYMLVLVTAELDHNTRMGILFSTIIVFAFRAAPSGRRRLLLVDAGRAQFRRRVLRHAAADRRDPVDRRDVAVQPAIDRMLRDQDAALDRGGRHRAVVPQHRAGLRRPPVDRGGVRLRRPQHRLRRCRGVLAVRAAQHGAAADADRVLCAARPSRHLVRADGLADEHRAGGVAIADQVSQRHLRGRARPVRRARAAADLGGGA